MKKLELARRENGQAIVIDVVGELTAGSDYERLTEMVRQAVGAGTRLVLINLKQCRRVDSSGIGELVTCLVTATRQDARLRLTDVPQPILGIMKITNVLKAFEVFTTEDEALAGA
ncbi:MAG TPA: STAS domain-containing protein [Pyrinomonadaceae bacterium]